MKHNIVKTLNNILAHEQKLALHIAVFFVCGFLIHLLPFTRWFAIILTPYVLLSMSCLLVYYCYLSGKSALLKYMGLVAVFTFSMEVIGVKTGIIFGEYTYGETLGIKLLNVPFIIALNWIFVLLGAHSMSRAISKNIYSAIFLSGIIAVLFDFVLEPVAMALDYWNWASAPSIPLQNYIAWFVITLICSSFFYISKKKDTKRYYLLEYYLVIQFFFFLLLRLFVI